MSGRKRKVLATSDTEDGGRDDDDDYGSTSASPQVKRTRGTDASVGSASNASSPQAESDMGTPSAGSGNGDTAADGSGTQDEDEMEDDDELDDEDDEDEEELQRIQAGSEAARRYGGSVAEAGVIERIEVKNFMCHNHLVVPLGPQINFIIGHNGSGKSAILTGITIALGGKASSTNRGNSLKSFVKEGRSAANIELILRNRGSEAYRPEVYGDKIVIERRINADGGGGWKIKSAGGRVISTKREELTAICDHNNIQVRQLRRSSGRVILRLITYDTDILQVDNPMNVLSQDAARQFLSSSHGSQKYSFFLRGTQLAQLAHEYNVVQNNIVRIRTVVEKKREVLPDLETKARDAVARHEAIKKMRDQRVRVEQMKNEFMWAQVVEEEKVLEKAIEMQVRAQRKLEKQKAELAKAVAGLAECETAITECEARVNERSGREQPLKEELVRLRQEYKEKSAGLKAIRAKEGEINQQHQRHRASIDDLQNRINDEAQRLSDNNREKREALNQQRLDAEARKREFEQEMLTVQGRISELETDMAQTQDEEGKATEQRDAARNRINELETYIQRTMRARGNRMAAFGERVPELLRAIQQETRWRQRPVGPIGAHIKLKDMRWSAVLESVIGNTLNAFCVTNHHDRRLLDQLKSRTGCNQVPTLTGSDEPFDFSAGEPPSDVLTILRVLEIDNDFVLRQLVNAVHIEQAALVDARQEGDQLMRKRLRNVHSAFSRDLFRISGGDKGSSTQTLNPHRGTPRLTANVESSLQEAKTAHAQIEAKLVDINGQLHQLSMTKSRLHQELRTARQSLPVLRNKARAQADLRDRLADEMHEDEPANVAALLEAKAEAEAELEETKAQFARLQDEKVVVEEAVQPLVEKIENIQNQLETLTEHRSRLQPELEKQVAARLQHTKAKQHWERAIEEQTTLVEQADDEVQMVEQRVEKVTHEAEKFCPEKLVPEMSAKSYQQAILSIEKEVATSERQNGQSVDQILQEVAACQKAFLTAKEEIDGFRAAIKTMDASLRLRKEKWLYFRRYVALSARGHFSLHLSQRGYTGSLEFNHTAESLKLRVSPEETTRSKSSREKDPKSLSGGEKSFSTICLLLSLWEAIGCPIRCLDEFDVFMDAVNRRISMKMMIDMAKSSQGVQYVLITPQNMANMPLGPQVRVHRLADPERDQGVLA